MAGLANGVAVVTNLGPLSDPLWREQDWPNVAPLAEPSKLADAVERTLSLTGPDRARIGERGADLYRTHFSLERTIAALRREPPSESDRAAVAAQSSDDVGTGASRQSTAEQCNGGAKAREHRRLRIAFVVHDYHRHGGHARYTAELASRFKNEHDVTVFANTFEDPDPRGITYRHVPAWRANALTTIVSFILPATLRLRGRFDVVHAQGLCGLRQDVVTAHMCQAAWCDAADRYAGPQPWRKRVFGSVVSRLERIAMRPSSAARVIVPSRRVESDLWTHFGVAERIRVVPHGTDTEVFHPRNRTLWRHSVRAQVGFTENDVVALYVGDLQKALPAALKTIAATPNVKLLVVSKSDPGPYRAQAEQLGIVERVAFHPAASEIARFYAAADLFLFPTYYDTFGLVITEAMASGLPVITSSAAGAADVITHGVSGWLTAEPWNISELTAGLQALAGDPELRARMGAAARSAVETYTWDRVAADTMAVYEEVLAERGER
jgi:UDP-glucose:(heptosyl)LPS alpha-1,3-glucosyltransferase